MTERFSLEGKVCVVTGGGRGLGRAIAAGLADHGARVVVSGRNLKTLQDAAAEISAHGGQISACAADVSSEAEVERLAQYVNEAYGPADVLVNNAGINPYYIRTEHTTFDQWREIIDVNLNGVFLCSRAFGRQMLAAGRGSLIHVTSIGAHVGLSRTGAYCAAKGGVELFSKSIALDWAPRGVRSNCIAPGYIATDLTAGLVANDGLNNALISKIPAGRIARPQDFAGAAIYLASDASAYMTGQAIVVDGGWTAA